ncbi:MAG: hypothetical protein ACR5KW_02945 [Wolbachia sp.]
MIEIVHNNCEVIALLKKALLLGIFSKLWHSLIEASFVLPYLISKAIQSYHCTNYNSSNYLYLTKSLYCIIQPLQATSECGIFFEKTIIDALKNTAVNAPSIKKC